MKTMTWLEEELITDSFCDYIQMYSLNLQKCDNHEI